MVVHTLKTPATLLVSWMLFGNEVGVIQIVGFVIITMGVYYYKHYGEEIKEEAEYDGVNKQEELEQLDIEENGAETASVSSGGDSQ
mmetsp:Transcript_4439/g.4060  ORF Transcript_4439/g.4060 Transcript_4439/m.4060 type:complete len:86 (+) Transcript_4439:1-258(+)